MTSTLLPAVEAVFSARKSVRRFTTQVVETATLERLVALAVTAPSASNKQPWRFVIVRNKSVIDTLASKVRQACEHAQAHMDPEAVSAFAAYGSYFTRFEAAPCVIAVTCRASAIASHLLQPTVDATVKDAIVAMEKTSAIVSASLAIEQLLLAAPALGLGASAMTGPLIAATALREVLNIPASWDTLALVAIGYPDEQPATTARKSAESVIRWIDS
jgi:nitroreductase